MSDGTRDGRGPGVRPPHQATVVQPRAPHAARVAQGKGLPPHAATVAQGKGLPPHAATVAQGTQQSPARRPAADGGSSIQRVRVKLTDGFSVNTDDLGQVKTEVERLIGFGRQDIIDELRGKAASFPDVLRAITEVENDYQEADPDIRFIKNAPNPFKPYAWVGGEGRPRRPVEASARIYGAQDIVVHRGSREAFLAAAPGMAFTGVVLMNHRGVVGGERKAKLFLHAVMPHDSYPTRAPGDVSTRIYGTTYDDPVTHQQGVNPSHEMLARRIEEARSRKGGRTKREQWDEWADDFDSEDAPGEKQRGYNRIGFTVVKVAPGRHRFSFTSTSQNAESFPLNSVARSALGSQEEITNRSRYPPRDWAVAIVNAVNAL